MVRLATRAFAFNFIAITTDVFVCNEKETSAAVAVAASGSVVVIGSVVSVGGFTVKKNCAFNRISFIVVLN